MTRVSLKRCQGRRVVVESATQGRALKKEREGLNVVLGDVNQVSLTGVMALVGM